MEYIEVVTPASVLPVSTADMKAHLRLNDATEDALLSDWIEAASHMFQAHTGYVLTETVFKLYLDSWPEGGVIFIPRRPMKVITSTEYLDEAGTWQTLAGTTNDAKSTPARIVLPSTLPTLHATQVPKVRVSFTAGHATASVVPKPALVAVKLLVSHWYGQREAYGEVTLNEVPMGWKAVCDQHKTGIVGAWN